MGPGQGCGENTGQSEEPEARTKGENESQFLQVTAGRHPALGARAAAFPDEQEENNRGEKSVREIGVLPPLRPEQPAKGGDEHQQHRAECGKAARPATSGISGGAWGGGAHFAAVAGGLAWMA